MYLEHFPQQRENIMEVTISIKQASGEVVTIVRQLEDLGADSKFVDLENLVSNLGHSVLPEIELALLEQMSETFVGEKNREEERLS